MNLFRPVSYTHLKLAEELVNLTVKDVKELADILKEEYGIEPAAAAVAVAAPAAGGAAAAEAEQTEFDVILKSAGAAKLAVVKLVKELTGLGSVSYTHLVRPPRFLVKQIIYTGHDMSERKIHCKNAQRYDNGSNHHDRCTTLELRPRRPSYFIHQLVINI